MFKRLTLSIIMLLILNVLATSAQTFPVELVSVTTNQNNCGAAGGAGTISVRVNQAGTVTLRSYAYTEYYREVYEVGNSAGGGQVIDIPVNKPVVPEGTNMYYSVTIDNDFKTAVGVTINCTTGANTSGQVLGKDGRLNVGNDVPLAIYPKLDSTGAPYLEFWYATAKGLGRRILIVPAKSLAAASTENVLIANTKDGFVNLYKLANGEYQVNLAPDFEGKVPVIVFDTIQPSYVNRADY